MMLSQFPVGNKLTPTATPLHISQLVYQILRYTFAAQIDSYPFKWNEDINLTGVVFDTVFNKEAEIYGTKPIIICSCGPIMSAPIVTGDRAYGDVSSGDTYKVTMVNSSVMIDVISRAHAEVEILKNEVFNCLVAIRTVIPSFTNVTMITNITADKTRKFELDENMYIGPIGFSYTMQYAWSHVVAKNILAGMDIILNDAFGIKIGS